MNTNMRTEESIRRIQDHMKVHKIGEYPHILLKDALDMAISALWEKEKRENQKTLTLDELRKMDGEPVWVVCDEEATKTTPGFEPMAFWALIEVCEESIFLTNSLGGRTEYADDLELEDDGITIYLCKPKEDANAEMQ